MRHHYMGLKILLGLFLCLAIKTASAYSLAKFNNQIIAFSDTEKKVIKLVFDAQPENSQPLHCIINDKQVAVKRNSARENQRAQPDNGSASEEKASGKMELILRPVPGHDDQVVIDLNDNSVIMGASGILVELGSSEQSMNFERIQSLMALYYEPTSRMAAAMPEFSVFNILTVRSISDFIWNSITGDLRMTDSDSSSLLVPETLSMNATVRDSASDSTYITSFYGYSENVTNDGTSSPGGVISFIESNTEYNYSVFYARESPRNTPVPFQINNQSVPVTLTYINRQRIDQITRADNSEVRNEQQMLSDQLQRLAQQDARNLFYRQFLFTAPASK
ncbi:hypothetical protein [Endozoicomonas euniceicola]|uniref:Uncharacterized protein n=1 Tax=Endozoicomonas euniceicola TaxID=1234143 RepID=A0ABY6GWL1_9GAMM|nr:hypothetical protein [Endozoicomonas euniceicola]UYM17153.1 hypothetical protein NX720_04315 [Endozoicomonas euniceicola]